MNGIATTYEDTKTPITTPRWSEVILVDTLSSWQIEALIGVLKTANLPHDWDSYGSPPPSSWAVKTSIELLRSISLDDLPVPHIVPVSGGGIQIEWNFDHRELELEILPDGSVEYLKAEHGQPFEEGKFTPEASYQVQSLLAWLISG